MTLKEISRIIDYLAGLPSTPDTTPAAGGYYRIEIKAMSGGDVMVLAHRDRWQYERTGIVTADRIVVNKDRVKKILEAP